MTTNFNLDVLTLAFVVQNDNENWYMMYEKLDYQMENFLWGKSKTCFKKARL